MPQLQDFQFFQVDRLNEIYEKEQAFELHKHTNNQKEAAARAQVCLVFCVTTLTHALVCFPTMLIHVLPGGLFML